MREINLGFWEEMKNGIQYHLKNDNIANFQNWREIQTTMIAGVDNIEYDYLLKCKNWDEWKNKLSENVLKPNSHAIFNQSSTNNLHHAYSLQRLMEESNYKLNEFDDIVEFGGGYGNVCRLFKTWGHQTQYYSYDIPELIEIQKYYLSKNNITNNVQFKTDYDVIDSVEGNSLFLAMWSVSEVPVSEREEILKNLRAFDCKTIFIAMGGMFQSEDNIAWLNQSIIPRLNSLEYEHKLINIKHGVDMFFFVAKRNINKVK